MKNLPPSAAQREQGSRVIGSWTIKGSDRKVPDRCPVFTEIVLGGIAYRTKEKMIYFLTNRGLIKPNDAELVEKIIHSGAFQLTLRREDHKLGLATPKDLGLPQGGTLKEIYKKAAGKDLVLTLPDAGLQTMLQVHSSWTRHDSILMASELIALNGEEYLFEVSSSHVRAVKVDPKQIIGADQHFLFRRL